MDEIDLDFLKTPPKHGNKGERIGSPFVFNELDVKFGRKKCSKKFELAKNIAKVDELVQETESLKIKNLELQQQLKGFQASAQQVQDLYIQEKNGHSVARQTLNKLQKEYTEADEKLENMILVNEQLKARLAEYDGRPISFEDLCVKYVKVMLKFQDHDVNKYSQDKSLVEKLREYCKDMNYKIPRAVSTKKSSSRGNKTKTQETFVQCDLLENSLKTQDCDTCKLKPILRDQSTQCSNTKRDQTTQYISTMITRQTNTEKIIQKHVQTMFPELLTIDDILNSYSKWSNIRPVSPLLQSPTRTGPCKELKKSMSTVGTCTMLCNIRRKMDYLPPNNSSNIKQEFFTPSASPTPNTYSTTATDSRVNSISNNVMGNINSSFLNLLNSTTNSSLTHLSFETFNELWQIFGKMLLSLIQNSNTGISSTNQTSLLNRQQFLDWLLELYTNVQTQNSTSNTSFSQGLDNRDTNVLVSPLTFNSTSVLSPNVLRPQPQKKLPIENDDDMTEATNETVNQNVIDNYTNNLISSTDSLDGSVESSTQTSDSENKKSQQNKIPTKAITTQTNICEFNLQEINTNCSTNLDGKEKNKFTILSEIQKLLPGIKLTKEKRKILKRLLRSKNHRKKSYKNRKITKLEKVNKESSVVILANDNIDSTTETAVDFLKTFVVDEQNNKPIEENFSETEKKFFEQVLNEDVNRNKSNNYLITDESTLNQASSSLTRPSAKTNRKSKTSEKMENKYQLLFGDSESEEVEYENFNLKSKPVINLNLKSSNVKRDNNACTLSSVEKPALDIVRLANSNQNNYINDNLSGMLNKRCVQQDSIESNNSILNLCNIYPNTNTDGLVRNQGCHVTHSNESQNSPQMSENSFDTSQEFVGLPDIPMQILKDLGCGYTSDIQFEIDKNTELVCYDNNPQNLNASPIIINNSLVNKNNTKNSDLELLSDVYSVKKKDEMGKETNSTAEAEVKLNWDESIIQNINNFIQQEDGKSDISESQEIPTKQDNLVQTIENAEEANLKSLPKLDEDECSNDSLPSQPIIISSTTLYSTDLEKDFELSSDNESLPSDNESIVILESSESTGKNSRLQENNSSHIFSIFEGEDHQLNENAEQKLNSNIFSAKVIENNILKNQDNTDEIFTLNLNKKLDKSTPYSDSSEIKSSLVDVLKTGCISKDCFDRESENINNIPNCTENVFTVNKQHAIGAESIKEMSNNHKEELKTSENKTKVKDEHEKHSLKSIDINQSKSHNSCNGINDSSALSVITISDSSSNDDLLKKEEIYATFNEKSDKKDLPKTSGLRSLKLLGLNKTLRPEKSCTNLKLNVYESHDSNEMHENTKLPTTAEKTMLLNNTDIHNPTRCDIEKIYKNQVSQHLNISKTISCSSSVKTFPIENVNENKNLLYTSQKMSNTSELQSKFTNGELEYKTPIETSTIEKSFFTNIYSMKQYESIDDKYDLSDSCSLEDELMIEEEPNEVTSELLETNPLDISDAESEIKWNNTLDSSNISTLLNSSLYNEVLSESIEPITNDLCKENLVTTSVASETKNKRERKRKSECLLELQPCKRSQRLKAKRMILEESINLSETEIKFPNYSNRKTVLNNIQQKFPQKEIKPSKFITPKEEEVQKTKMLENENIIQLGFFKERVVENDKVNKTIISLKSANKQKSVEEIDKTCTILESNKNHPIESLSDFFNQNISSVSESEEDCANSCSPDDLIIKPPAHNLIFTVSPQSPTPDCLQNNTDVTDAIIIIPEERPQEYMPQDNNSKLFDVLIDTYKNEHQKQVLESIAQKELKRKDNILKQFEKEINLYCYSEMDLELYCTSTSLINKLLSLYPDFDLIQKAIITVALNAGSSNVSENDFPSIIQEMPPRHLSKCLQRLFTFLRNIVTRNDSFCQDLMDKIESFLFNSKQTENVSLQATLNITQLYLMASKVQEYLQIPKHPARLFIAKCLYFHFKKSILMIHEVLLWYPTVLPHREDKTYDRSDALISVIQQILMNTKYEMDNPDLRGKLLISKLRFEYHFEPFKPTVDEVIKVLVEKLKNSKFYNISLAFGVFCKRIGVIKTQNIVLDQYLLPLANEYYNLALKTNEYDKRIEVLLEIISMILKSLPIETDTKKYFSQFSRFLNGFERKIIQEAAVCSILRLQRFNVQYCYSLLCHFQPSYNLNTHTQAMLKSFLYRRPLTFWKNLKSKNFINCN